MSDARIIKIDPDDPGPALAEAAEALKAGALVAYPTESYYAVGADATAAEAVRRVFAAKGRGYYKPLPVIIHDKAMLGRYVAGLTPAGKLAVEGLMPGAVTLVFGASKSLPDALTAGTGRVGIRLPAHNIAAGLAAALGGPVTATSANLSGEPGLCTAREVKEALGLHISLILDGGKTPCGAASSVVDVSGPEPVLLRAGLVEKALIEAVLGSLKTEAQGADLS